MSAPAPGSLAGIEIPATDLERAKAFYTQVFSWSYEAPSASHLSSRIAKLDGASGVNGGILKVDSVSGGANSVVPHLFVGSISAALDVVAKAGGKVIQGKEAQDGGFTAKVQDPEGNVLALFGLEA
ncbi:hypothetical protein F5884DRAFT_338928 [Xylogone sp. PMI_703]|nr:hypothetical protein F5884DRAFT_338928 [Xylogone sp. PMI_703]